MSDFQTPIEAENFARGLARLGLPRSGGGQFHVAYNWGYEDERRKMSEFKIPSDRPILPPLQPSILDSPRPRLKGPFDL